MLELQNRPAGQQAVQVVGLELDRRQGYTHLHTPLEL
jgi:hypothetical protein